MKGTSAPTFDMSGGPKDAKRPLERPLDGRVRAHSVSGERSNCRTRRGRPAESHGAGRTDLMRSRARHQPARAATWYKLARIPVAVPRRRCPGLGALA